MGVDLLQELDLITRGFSPHAGTRTLVPLRGPAGLGVGRLRVLDAKHLLDDAPVNVVN